MTNPENTEWQAPPPPERIEPVEAPQMSEVATLGNIFIEPGRTFEDLKRKPRFLMASIIIALLVSAYGFGMYYKVGEEGMRAFTIEQMDKSPQAASMPAEQRTSMISMSMTFQMVARYAMPVFILFFLVIGGLIYWAASKAFGGTGGFLHALSVWVYSSLPPTVVAMIANFIVLAVKSVDDINIAASQRGVLQANPNILIDTTANPVLATLLVTLDVFMIWGWVLAAIGLRIVNKISSGSAWAIIIILAVIGLLFRLIGSYFSGTAM